MQAIAPELSRKIANMNVIAAFMVVILHAGEPQMIGSSGWWWVEIFKTVSKVAVPYFFVAAGFFLAGHIDESGWWRKEVVKRMRTLMIPFVTWSLLWWLFYLPFGIYADYLHSRELGFSLSLFDGKWVRILGINLFQCPFYSPLWFLRALFLIVVLSPVLSYCVKKAGGAILLFIAYWLITPEADHRDEWRWFFRYGVSLFGMFWFVLGMVARNRVKNWADIYPHGRWSAAIALAISVALLVVHCASRCGCCNLGISLEPIFILFALYGAFYFVPSIKFADVLTRNAFPVYLLHSFFIFMVGLMLKNQDSWLCLSARTIFAFVASLCCAAILKTLLPRFAAVVFGGR